MYGIVAYICHTNQRFTYVNILYMDPLGYLPCEELIVGVSLRDSWFDFCWPDLAPKCGWINIIA